MTPSPRPTRAACSSATTASGANAQFTFKNGALTGTLTPSGSSTATSFIGLSSATAVTTRIINLSARANVGTGSNVLVAGFVVGGTGTKQVLIRGDGPSLGIAPFNLAGALAAPQLTIFNSAGTSLYFNDRWGNLATLSQAFTQVQAFPFAANSLDTAILQPYTAGSAYTAQVNGANSTSGLALAEIYDADVGTPTARLLNISARANIGSGINNLVAGFVITGNSSGDGADPRRGPGPGARTVQPRPGVLATPTLPLFNASGATLATNTALGRLRGALLRLHLGRSLPLRLGLERHRHPDHAGPRSLHRHRERRGHQRRPRPRGSLRESRSTNRSASAQLANPRFAARRTGSSCILSSVQRARLRLLNAGYLAADFGAGCAAPKSDSGRFIKRTGIFSSKIRRRRI